MKILIIYNPTAGQRKRQKFGQVISLLKESNVTVNVLESQAAGHAEQLAAENGGANYDLIAAAGGDGTINEVINGHYPSQKPLGLIPLGTANVLAKEIGLDETPAGIVAALLSGNSIACRLGSINGRLYSLMISVGLDAFVVAEVNLGLKKSLGTGAYALSFLKQLIVSPKVVYTVTVDGQKYTAAGAIVTKGRYYGGKYICAPDALLTDDSIHVVILQGKGCFANMRYAWAMFANKLPLARDVIIIKAKEIAIKAQEGQVPFQVDGDCGGKLPVTICLSEKLINIVSK